MASDLHKLLGELRQFVDTVAGENRPSREWAIALRSAIDSLPEADICRAEASAGAVKAGTRLASSAEAFARRFSMNDLPEDDDRQRQAVLDQVRLFREALATQPAAPQEAPAEVEAVGYLFRLNYGKGNWSRQDMFSSTLPDDPDDVKDVRPLYANPPTVQAVTEAQAIRDDALEEAAKLVEEGFDRQVGIPWHEDEKPSKNDRCVHSHPMYEDCEACAVVAIRALKGAKP